MRNDLPESLDVDVMLPGELLGMTEPGGGAGRRKLERHYRASSTVPSLAS